MLGAHGMAAAAVRQAQQVSGNPSAAMMCAVALQVCFSLQLESVVVLEYQGPTPQQHKQPAAAATPAGQAIDFHR